MKSEVLDGVTYVLSPYDVGAVRDSVCLEFCDYGVDKEARIGGNWDCDSRICSTSGFKCLKKQVEVTTSQSSFLGL